MRSLVPLRYVEVVARSGSIRRAAEELSITSTALNRRILALEAELGVPIFERLPRGVRLNSAGEIMLHHIRNQVSDMERVKSRIADLAGIRRGHVSIACSQAVLPYFLPEEVRRYRDAHPFVTFTVQRRDRGAAEEALVAHEADIALVFEPVRLADVQRLATIRQPIAAVLAADHPLAGKQVLRLNECLGYPIALPTADYGVRHMLEIAAVRGGLRLEPVIQSDSFDFLRHTVAGGDVVSFQVPIGLPPDPSERPFAVRPIDGRDLPAGTLVMGQLRGRTLPVAAAKFADQVASRLETDFG